MDCTNFIPDLSAALDVYFGFNTQLFELAVSGSLVVFALGFGIGLIINTVRKGRTL